MKLATKLTLLFLLLSTVPLAVVGFLAFDNSRQAIEQDTIDRLLTTTILKKDEFEAWIDDSKRDIRILAINPLVRQYAAVLAEYDSVDPQYQAAYDHILQDHFALFLQEKTGFLNFLLIRARDGLILLSTREGLEGKYRESEPFFIEGKKDTYVDNITYSVTLGEQVMSISTPVKDEKGSVVAVLVGYLNLADISAIMAQRSGLRETEETYLVNTFNFMVTESRFEANSSLRKAVYTEGVNNCLTGYDGSGHYDDYRDVPVIGVYQWISEHEMCIVTEIDQSEAFQPVVDLRQSILGISVFVVLGTGALALVFARTITGPVQQLARGAEEIGRGNLDYRILAQGRDEIGLLARAFNDMAGRRKRDEEALRTSEERLKYLLFSSPAVIYTSKPYGDYGATFISENALLQTGYNPEAFMEDPHFWTDHIHPEDAPRVLNELSALFEHGHHLHEYRFMGKDGTYRWMRDELTLIRDANGQPVETIGCWIDITERKRAEEMLQQRTAQLEASNKELEAFSYSISHDLRAPLRAMDGFSRILLDEYAPDLSGEAQRYLGLVRDNARQMGDLINHLLAFSRLGRQSLQKESVAPSDLVQAALADLNAEQEGREVEITINDLPPCQADPALLRQVFANLLGNALKFTKTREVATIKVGCHHQADESVYFVRDNGVGFDMKYANKLFGVFQRLHRAEDYEGTGVGLATVQRIIHRHGGRIWAESELDKGTTFYFTIEKGDS